MSNETAPTNTPQRRPSVSACSGKLYRLVGIYRELDRLVRGRDNLHVLRPIPGGDVAEVAVKLKEILMDWDRLASRGNPDDYWDDVFEDVTGEVAALLALDPQRPDYKVVMERLRNFVRSHDLYECRPETMATRWREFDMDPGSRAGSNR